jgi:hypothetical protein
VDDSIDREFGVQGGQAGIPIEATAGFDDVQGFLFSLLHLMRVTPLPSNPQPAIQLFWKTAGADLRE